MTSGFLRPVEHGPRLLNATMSSTESVIESDWIGALGKSSGHHWPYVVANSPGRLFSHAPTVRQFFAVPAGVMLPAAIVLAPAAVLRALRARPPLPAAKTIKKSGCSQMNRPTSRDWAS